MVSAKRSRRGDFLGLLRGEDDGDDRDLLALTGNMLCVFKPVDNPANDRGIEAGTMDAEVDYQGYRLKVVHTDPGWTVFICAPESRFRFDAMQTSRDRDDRDWVIAEAKALVDAHMRKVETTRCSHPAN